MINPPIRAGQQNLPTFITMKTNKHFHNQQDWDIQTVSYNKNVVAKNYLN